MSLWSDRASAFSFNCINGFGYLTAVIRDYFFIVWKHMNSFDSCYSIAVMWKAERGLFVLKRGKTFDFLTLFIGVVSMLFIGVVSIFDVCLLCLKSKETNVVLIIQGFVSKHLL